MVLGASLGNSRALFRKIGGCADSTARFDLHHAKPLLSLNVVYGAVLVSDPSCGTRGHMIWLYARTIYTHMARWIMTYVSMSRCGAVLLLLTSGTWQNSTYSPLTHYRPPCCIHTRA